MAPYVTYLLQANLSLVIFYAIYAFVVQKDTHFKHHRFYLSFTLLLSVVLPLFSDLFQVPVQGTLATIVLQAVTIGPAIPEAAPTAEIGFMGTFFWISLYATISLMLVVRLIWQVLQIRKIRHASELETTPDGNLYWTDQPTAFSFMRNMFIPAKLRNSDDVTVILEHEKVHVQQLHTLDVFLSEIVTALFWINPVVWLYRKNIKETHEYLADGAVKEHCNDSSRYQMLLFHHGVGFSMGLTNAFNQSLTLKRFIMLTKEQSSPISKLKSLIIIPLTGILLVTFACNQSEDISDKKSKENKTTATETLPETSGKVITAKDVKVEGEVFTSVENPPMYKGGMQELINYLKANIQYPAEAKAKGIQGKVFVSFVVTKTGAIADVKIKQGVHDLLDTEALRVVQSMPDWEPGKQKDELVNVSYVLPINFALQ
jgi:TonB family protein